MPGNTARRRDDGEAMLARKGRQSEQSERERDRENEIGREVDRHREWRDSHGEIKKKITRERGSLRELGGVKNRAEKNA